MSGKKVVSNCSQCQVEFTNRPHVLSKHNLAMLNGHDAATKAQDVSPTCILADYQLVKD
jgi:hypothetical protein